MGKENLSDDEEFNYSQPEENISPEPEEDDLDYQTTGEVGEKFSDKAILELLLDTEIVLKNLQRNMEGLEEINGEFKQLRLPIARDEVIAFVINSLRSIINPSNSFAYIEADAAKVSIYEKILEFEYMAVEEFTIDARDQETLINMCDHTLELFYGKVIEGHLTTALKDIFAGTHTMAEKTKPESMFSLRGIMGENTK